MACVNPQNPQCPNCNKSGLAILPARYAVVPNSISATLPAPLGSKVTDVKLAHHHYALRTLRQGYVYLYYEKHARGSHIKWEVYSVAPDGMLYQQLSTNAIRPATKPMEQVCARNSDNYPASLIAIYHPEKCGKVWMAFSEHAWSADIFKQFETDAKLRDRRMQSFAPAQLASTGKHKHGIEATENNIKQIIEYKDDFVKKTLDNPMSQTISNLVVHTKDKAHPVELETNGAYSSSVLNSANTIHGLSMRQQQSKKTVETMQKVSERMNGEPYKPVIFALWDEMGITHELNGFRNETAGYIDQYQNERAIQISAFNAINNLKAALEEKAKNKAQASLRREVFKWSKQQENIYLGGPRSTYQVINNQADYQKNEKSLVKLWEQDAAKGARRELAYIRQHFTGLSTTEFNQKMVELTKSIDRELEEYHSQATQQLLKKRAADYYQDEWSVYEDEIDPKQFDAFSKNYGRFQNESSTLIDQRTADLLAWLQSHSLDDALTEYHDNNLNDGIAFEDKIGDIIWGINTCEAGGKLIDAWVAEIKASPSNLLWRAIARNQKSAMEELNKTLAEAIAAKSIEASNFNWRDYGIKGLQTFIGLFKGEVDAASATQANQPAAQQKARLLFANKPLPTPPLDKIMLTAGDRIFRHFRALDKASEKIIQHVFMIRALIAPEDSIKLLINQTKYEKPARAQQVERYRSTQRPFATDKPVLLKTETQLLLDSWDDFSKHTSKGANAVRDARLSLVIMCIEGLNFSNMLSDPNIQGNQAAWLSFAASGLTITSGLVEISSIPAKELIGENSRSYLRLKLAGGILSSGATAIGAVLDAKDAAKYFGKERYGIAVLYFAKFALGAVTASLIVASNLSPAASLIGRLTGRQIAKSALIEVISLRAAGILVTRFAFMSLGSWFTLGAFAVQGLIWVFSPNDMENWVNNSALGKGRKSDDAYGGKIAQENAFIAAYIEVGMAH